ncbi:LLM class flavin-dependent oxidoreductase [Streptomyces pseudovenezuelae]|uniref:LLM class flavin-dependent oxidoreductase n=1 Tax=Streptomyces pseudovenezuelae TaxID=67350 RepID=UPI002E3043A5|nr:LLM class flavin-dependent oxidoreductase [Streptomyces pseudovenezuelae]
MASSHGRGLVHLAAALDQPSAYDALPYVEAARLAERGGLDFVTLDDTLARPGLDALAVLSRVASATGRIGLVPTVASTHPELFPAQAAVATLDRVSRGRAGWRIDRETGEVADVAAKLWDGREGDTEIGDMPNGGPRPPHGHPVRVVDATDEPARRTAARYADVALVRAASAAQAAAERDRLHAMAAEFGRRPEELRVLAGLLVDLGDGEHAAAPGHGGGGPRQTAQGPLYRGGPVDLAALIATWHGEGVVDGFHLTPAEPLRDLERLVNGTVALLQHRGLFRTFYPGSTLREHLDLAVPAHRCG